jgi:hypothetical protein
VSVLEFARTPMGRRFFEATVPKIADELARLNTTLEPIAAALQALTSPPMAGHGVAAAAETNPKAALVQIALGRMPIDAADPQGDGLGLHGTIASALEIALSAAYQAGVAATLRELRADQRNDATTPR